MVGGNLPHVLIASKELDEVDLSLVDSFPVIKDDKAYLVIAVRILGGRRGHSIAGQIQRLIIKTIAKKIGKLKPISSTGEIKALLELKKSQIEFI